MKIYSLFLITMISLYGSSGQGKPIEDRLLLRIEQQTYSQRQLETYLLIKRVLNTEKGVLVSLINQKNWGASFKEFHTDMVILMDASKRGVHQPKPAVINSKLSFFEERVKGSKAIADEISRLSIDQKALVSIITEMLQIHAYRQAKNSTENNGNWLGSMLRESSFFYFDDSQDFVKIAPKNN